MGFINSASTITVRARLTKLGREKILTNNNKIFSHFILGDSDANYNTSEKLTTGLVPTNSGNIGYNSGTNDNIAENVFINSKLYVVVNKKICDIRTLVCIDKFGYCGKSNLKFKSSPLQRIICFRLS